MTAGGGKSWNVPCLFPLALPNTPLYEMTELFGAYITEKP